MPHIWFSELLLSFSFYLFIYFFFGLSFVIFFLLNIYKSPHIYCYTDITNFTILLYNKSNYVATMLRHYASRVLTLCNTIVATIYFFSSNIWFVFFFFLLNIDISWHLYCYTDTTNFTIFSQLLTCQFLTSWNKIIFS